jgi:caa(3)-type oxidase subunit IV
MFREATVSTRANVVVAAVALVLTLATTILGRVDLDPWNLVIALAIAAAKALLIILYFFTPGVTRLVVVAGALWLALILIGTMDDYVTRAWLSVPGH